MYQKKGCGILLNIGDNVLCSGRGVYTVTDKILIDNNEYYALSSVYGKDMTLYVPVKDAGNRIKRLLSKDDIDEIISEISVENMQWIENDKERQSAFKEILVSGDRKKLMLLIKVLFLHQQELKKQNKKLHISDEKAFKDAQGLLHDEIAYALNIDRNNVVEYIAKKIN